MKAHGNGNPETCASNLLRIVRGEVPYDRVKGRDGSLIDRPNATEEALADAEWVLNTYEPRIDVESIGANRQALLSGDLAMIANIKRKEDEEEWQSSNS